MHEPQDPFASYIGQVLRHLGKLHPEQRANIARELQDHLEDIAAEHGEQASNPTVRAMIVSGMGSSRRVGRELARTYRDGQPNRIVMLLFNLVRAGIATCAVLLCLLFGLTSFFMVPAPSPETATLITGTVSSISRPHPEYGDLSIRLRDGRNFYVNRANENELFAWEELLKEVKAGDTIHITAIDTWLTRDEMLGRGRAYSPVAGVRTDSKVYLDPDEMAEEWGAAPNMPLTIALTLLVVAACYAPELRRTMRNAKLKTQN
jgi:hypothetical protein